MFSNSSYGFRPGKSARQAVRQAQLFIQQGKRIVVDIDLEKFFDRVNHDILMSKLASSITDKRILRIIRRSLQSGVMLNGCCVATEEGTPQGGPMSPLLATMHYPQKMLILREKRSERYKKARGHHESFANG